MSTILKALRRLEEDRNANPSRSLREAVTSGGDESTRRSSGWLLAVALLLVVGSGASAGTYWWLSRGPAPEVAARPAAEPDIAPVVAETPEPLAPAEPVVAALAGPEETEAPVVRFEPERELPPEALSSPVEMVTRPPAEPRIAEADPENGVVFGTSSDAGATPVAAKRGSRRPVTSAVPLTRRNVAAALDAVAGMEPSPPPARVAGAATRSQTRANGDAWDQAVAADAAERGVETASAPPPEPRASRSEAPVKTKTAQTGSSAATKTAQTGFAAATKTSTAKAETSGASSRTEARSSGRTQTTAGVRAEVKAPAPAPKQTSAARGSERPSSRSASKASEPARVAAAAPKADASAPVPGVRVEKTSWHPSSDRRTARIAVDGGFEEIREGDAVGPLVVSRIEPSGVVFDHDGVEIRRRVGE
jgi:hypothetical protein